MNANELMLGNYVELYNPDAWLPFHNKPMLVTKIDRDLTQKEKEIWNKSNGIISLIFKHNTFNQFSEFIKPITLTEQWLLDFRFKKEFDYWNLNDFEIADLGNGKWVNCVNSNEYNNGEPFLYVHQLQNLYFALTGNPLQLVEPK